MGGQGVAGSISIRSHVGSREVWCCSAYAMVQPIIPLLVERTGFCNASLEAWLLTHHESLRARHQKLLSLEDGIERRRRSLMVQTVFDAWESALNPWAGLA